MYLVSVPPNAIGVVFFSLRDAGTKWLTFFEVIDELGGTVRTDHLDSRTSKTQVSASPENLLLVRSCHTTGANAFVLKACKAHI
jgi:hypothetical protein